MKLVEKVKVQNKLGLHTRPATEIVKLLQQCESSVHFTYKRQTVNAKSILGILMLAAGKNSDITITCDGADASNTMDLLKRAFEGKFGENEV